MEKLPISSKISFVRIFRLSFELNAFVWLNSTEICMIGQSISIEGLWFLFIKTEKLFLLYKIDEICYKIYKWSYCYYKYLYYKEKQQKDSLIDWFLNLSVNSKSRNFYEEYLSQLVTHNSFIIIIDCLEFYFYFCIELIYQCFSCNIWFTFYYTNLSGILFRILIETQEKVIKLWGLLK